MLPPRTSHLCTISPTAARPWSPARSVFTTRFRRIFSVGTMGVSTYNPSSMEATNQWLYEDFLGIVPGARGGSPHEFTILVRKGKKSETMRFSSEHRAELITETLRYRAGFGEPQEETFVSGRVCLGLGVG